MFYINYGGVYVYVFGSRGLAFNFRVVHKTVKGHFLYNPSSKGTKHISKLGPFNYTEKYAVLYRIYTFHSNDYGLR